jgi:AcrR family transcriptional regulator
LAQPRPKENVRRARAELYQKLVLEAAEKSFAERGFDATRMEQIATESGLSLGTVYSVFAGKPDLMRAVQAIRNREILALASAAAGRATGPLERLLAAVRAYVEFFASHPEYLRIHLRGGHAWGLAAAGSKSRSHAHAWDEGIDLYAGLFEEGIAAGVFHPGPARLLARMMIAMQQVQLADWVERGLPDDLEALLTGVETQLRRAFGR